MTTVEQAAQRIGTTLREKWTLEKVIGVGGMAAVYVGLHKIGRRDAIKILHLEVARIEDVRARFEQEARAVNRFKHPGAVEIRDIDVTEDGAPFLVMELLEGETLAKRVRRGGAVPPTDVFRWADELLDVLAAAHEQGIIHRDIKPDNLFIQRSGALKVLDFGIARVRRGAEKVLRTREGTTLGTVAYMAPEQAKGDEIDVRSDLFAVGATMFRLLANRRAHEAESDVDLLRKVATEPAPPLGTVAPHLPREVCHVVDRALAFARDDRYPDARAMQAEVRAVLSGAEPASLPAAPAAPAPSSDAISVSWEPQPSSRGEGDPSDAASFANEATKVEPPPQWNDHTLRMPGAPAVPARGLASGEIPGLPSAPPPQPSPPSRSGQQVALGPISHAPAPSSAQRYVATIPPPSAPSSARPSGGVPAWALLVAIAGVALLTLGVVVVVLVVLGGPEPSPSPSPPSASAATGVPPDARSGARSAVVEPSAPAPLPPPPSAPSGKGKRKH